MISSSVPFQVYKCIPVVSSQLKVLVGFTFLLLRVLAFLSINLYINQTMTITYNKTCIFSNKTGMFIGKLDYRWLWVLAVEDCFFGVFAFIGVIEFLSSQVPYSMKEIFMGIFISIFSVFTILGVIVFMPFILNSPILSNGILSYGFWCFFSEAIRLGMHNSIPG